MEEMDKEEANTGERKEKVRKKEGENEQERKKE